MNKNKFYKESLNYHRKFPSGKIQIYPTKDYNTQHNLSLAYSPGVAAPCYEILKNPKTVYNYTSKGNLVGVITNGTAVLGLGKIGPLASKPVMEGKAILFKIFSGIDAYDIEINEYNPKKIIQIIKAISPTFGGIILEDIKAPEAFEIENILQEELDIPIMHDDQHGTAIISGAALLNAIELVNKKIENIKMVINGAGAAAISCARIYKKLGVKNIIMCDSHGVINNKRTDINQEKKEFSVKTSMKTLSEAIKDSDIFIGLSVKNILSTDMLKSMAKNPIVFALANPDPEIEYNLAIKTRNDLIIATGRSDYPNQVNNVLGFPYIFRGALDVQAKKINEEMKLAAIKSIALLTKEPDEYINLLYNKQLSFNKEYIIPKPFDKRLITHVSKAVAKAAMETGVARHNITNWDNYQKQLIDRIKNFR
ncbi:MAG: malate dehydrogenase [Candidatus Bostrichicola ureolyticus]|nr:MAG: malate dehydrogenase [Candidatus Bostrichicola ureolyticus]